MILCKSCLLTSEPSLRPLFFFHFLKSRVSFSGQVGHELLAVLLPQPLGISLMASHQCADDANDTPCGRLWFRKVASEWFDRTKEGNEWHPSPSSISIPSASFAQVAEPCAVFLWLEDARMNYYNFFFGGGVGRQALSMCFGCSGTHYVGQAGLQLTHPSISASGVLRLKACTITPGLDSVF